MKVALVIVVVPQQLRSLGNIVQSDEKYSRVVRMLVYDEGLNIGVVQRMIQSWTPCQGASWVAFIWINSARKWSCLFRGGILKKALRQPFWCPPKRDGDHVGHTHWINGLTVCLFSGQRGGAIHYNNCGQRTMSLMFIVMRQKWTCLHFIQYDCESKTLSIYENSRNL